MARVLLVATEWFPSKGGVTSFNMELAAALHRTGHEAHCVVKRAGQAAIDHARSLGVTLHDSAARGVDDDSPFDLGFVPDILVAHDRWTGPRAARWRLRLRQRTDGEQTPTRLALLLHVHPGQIDGLKGDESKAARTRRIEEGRRRILHAETACGVGQQLAEWWAADVPGTTVHPFVPGLPRLLPLQPRALPRHPRVLLLGRAEDEALKGVHLASRAVRSAAEAGFKHVELVLRGVPEGTEADVTREMQERYGTTLRFLPRPFDPDRETIARDLATSNLVLQPSLEEGFGLVTLEAIAAGTPVLVSDRAGVARLLRRVSPEAAGRIIVEAGNEAAWRDAILRVLGNIEVAQRDVEAVKSAIEAAHTWDEAAAALVATTMKAAPHEIDAPRANAVEACKRASENLAKYPRRINGEWIPRPQEPSVREWLATPLPDKESGVLLLVGPPGTGKSALLASLVEEANTRALPVLGIKADQLPASVHGEEELRAHLGLNRPIVDVLEELASVHGQALLVIDQLDALCAFVDSQTTRLNAILSLVRKATKIDDVRVVGSVRPFELHHEARLRHIDAKFVSLGGIEVDDLRRVMPDAFVPDHVDPSLLTPQAADLLAQVQHHEQAQFAFPSSLGQLRTRFWDHTTGAASGAEDAAIALAQTMGRRGTLWVKPSDTGMAQDDLDTLVAHGLLRQSGDGTEVCFRHQTIFDFARARGLIRDDSLEDHIAEHQQSFNVRPLVRSALLHLRELDFGRYVALARKLVSGEALHLRLLAIDTVLEADSPSQAERRLFIEAVNDDLSRRRALAGVAHRQGWLAALRPRISDWMLDFPEQTLSLAVGFLRLDPSAALDALESCWLDTTEGRARVVRVLALADRLPSLPIPLLERLAPQLVRSSAWELGPIARALGEVDVDAAVGLCAACLREEADVVAAGEHISSDARAADNLLELAADPGRVLDAVEPIAARFLDDSNYISGSLSFRETLEQLVEQLLDRLVGSCTDHLLGRADRLPQGSSLIGLYIAAAARAQRDVDQLGSWMAADPTRLRLDPESIIFFERQATKLSRDVVTQLDAAIDRVERYSLTPTMTAEQRHRRGKRNRAYRLCLRDRLPASLREPDRLAHDEAERHQMEYPYQPDRGPQGGLVVSPIPQDRFQLASDDDLLTAIEVNRGEWWSRSYTPAGNPIGGAEQVISQIRTQGKDDPIRVARLIAQLRDRGMEEQARSLLSGIAKSHPVPHDVETLALGLLAAWNDPLDVDRDCAWCLADLGRRGPLSGAAVDAIQQRLAGATDHTTPRPDPPASAQPRWSPSSNQEPEKPERTMAVFGGGRGPRAASAGAFPWLHALAIHHLRADAPSTEAWWCAIRAALSVDKRPETWALVLDDLGLAWQSLAGADGLTLVSEIRLASTSASTDLSNSLSRLHVYHRALDHERVRSWIDELLQQGRHAVASEIAVVLATDDPPLPWAVAALDEWRSSEQAADHATGVLAAVGELMSIAGRRTALSKIASTWLPLAHVRDLELLFRASFAPDVWRGDLASRRVLRSLLPRVGEMSVEDIRHFVFVLERVLDTDSMLVLDLTEATLDRVVEVDANASHIISECLALSISLRIAHRGSSSQVVDRIHALFERALAADAPAAFDVLDTMDGRGGGLAFRPPYIPRRRTGRRRHR